MLNRTSSTTSIPQYHHIWWRIRSRSVRCGNLSIITTFGGDGLQNFWNLKFATVLIKRRQVSRQYIYSTSWFVEVRTAGSLAVSTGRQGSWQDRSAVFKPLIGHRRLAPSRDQCRECICIIVVLVVLLTSKNHSNSKRWLCGDDVDLGSVWGF